MVSPVSPFSRRPEDGSYTCKISKDIDRDPKDAVFDNLFDLLLGLANHKLTRERPFTEVRGPYAGFWVAIFWECIACWMACKLRCDQHSIL